VNRFLAVVAALPTRPGHPVNAPLASAARQGGRFLRGQTVGAMVIVCPHFHKKRAAVMAATRFPLASG